MSVGYFQKRSGGAPTGNKRYYFRIPRAMDVPKGEDPIQSREAANEAAARVMIKRHVNKKLGRVPGSFLELKFIRAA